MLLLIANECYKTGQYLHAAKAFDLLGRMDDSPEHWEGKRGALVGVFQKVVSGDEPKETLLDILALLQNSNKSQVHIFEPDYLCVHIRGVRIGSLALALEKLGFFNSPSLQGEPTTFKNLGFHNHQ